MHLEDTYLGSPVQQKFANHFCYILTEKKYSTSNNTLIRTWNSICILATRKSKFLANISSHWNGSVLRGFGNYYRQSVEESISTWTA